MKHQKKVVKNFILACVLGTICLTILGCSNTDEKHQGLVITTIEVPFINCEDDFDIDDMDAVELQFINNGAVPYIDVTTYIDMIDAMLHYDVSDMVIDEQRITIEYNPVVYQTLNPPDAEDPNYRQSMIIDFEEDTVTVSSYLFFMYQGIEHVASETDIIQITDVAITEGKSVEIPFYEYGFDFIIEETDTEQNYLIPFHVASLLFNYSTLFKTYYNGDEIYGGGLCIYREEVVRSSSFNGLDIPDDIRLASFDVFTIALDYFSSMKQARQIESYRDLFMKQLPTIRYADSDDYYMEFTKLLYQVDDLHADLPAAGYYSSAPLETLPPFPSWYRPIRKAYYNTAGTYRSTFFSLFDGTSFPPTVRLLDEERIAVIHIYQFTETMPDEFKTYIDNLPPTVEHVVIDLSMNGGGNVNAIFHLLGYMTDQPIVYNNGIAIDGSSRTFTIEVEEDAYDYDWYILTSPVTFSAANIATLLAQENGIATIIGESSSGGASPIESILLPCGFSHTISGNYTFYSTSGTAELGVPVDIEMLNLWDDNELIDLINQP
jgi:hypothetical protein